MSGTTTEQNVEGHRDVGARCVNFVEERKQDAGKDRRGLSESQLEQFWSEGFLIIKGVFEEKDLQPLIDEYDTYIDTRARELFSQGKISSEYADEPFQSRLACICREKAEHTLYDELTVRKMRGRNFFNFLRSKPLLDVVSSVLGDEITASPIQHFRPKLPQGLTPRNGDPHVVPWHQDAAVALEVIKYPNNDNNTTLKLQHNQPQNTPFARTTTNHTSS